MSKRRKTSRRKRLVIYVCIDCCQARAITKKEYFAAARIKCYACGGTITKPSLHPEAKRARSAAVAMRQGASTTKEKRRAAGATRRKTSPN